MVQGRAGRGLAALIGAILLAIACASLAVGAKDDLVLVSAQSDADGGNGGDDGSNDAAISADGRYVAFASVANNLSNNDDNSYVNVFERDLQTNTTILISRLSAGAGGAAPNGPSIAPSISADGRYVAFASRAANLILASAGPMDGDGFNHVFVRDTRTDTTTIVDRSSTADGNHLGSGEADQPSISGDGRYVAFRSSSSNLTPPDSNSRDDIFRRDLQTNTTTLLSKQSDPAAGSSDGHSAEPSISADGRYVAFESAANVLSPTSVNGLTNIFIRDTQTNTTSLVSVQSDADGGHGAGGNSDVPAVSPDGRYVAFQSRSTNLSPADPNSQLDVYVRDTQAGTTALVSRETDADGGQVGDGASADPSVSNGGRYVAFDSTAGNLSTDDNDPVKDVFVRDTQGGITTLVSHQSPADGGASGTSDSGFPSITPDGRYVAFSSQADNISLHDENGIEDVFLVDTLGDQTTSPTTTTTTTTTTPDTTPPGLGSSHASSPQRLGKSLTVTVLSDEDASVDATATATPKGHVHGKKPKPLKFQATNTDVKAGGKTNIKLKPLRRTSRKLKHAKKGKAQVFLTATDGAGNSGTDTLKIKLR